MSICSAALIVAVWMLWTKQEDLPLMQLAFNDAAARHLCMMRAMTKQAALGLSTSTVLSVHRPTVSGANFRHRLLGTAGNPHMG